MREGQKKKGRGSDGEFVQGSIWRIKQKCVATYFMSDIYVSPIYFLTDK